MGRQAVGLGVLRRALRGEFRPICGRRGTVIGQGLSDGGAQTMKQAFRALRSYAVRLHLALLTATAVGPDPDSDTDSDTDSGTGTDAEGGRNCAGVISPDIR